MPFHFHVQSSRSKHRLTVREISKFLYHRNAVTRFSLYDSVLDMWPFFRFFYFVRVSYAVRVPKRRDDNFQRSFKVSQYLHSAVFISRRLHEGVLINGKEISWERISGSFQNNPDISWIFMKSWGIFYLYKGVHPAYETLNLFTRLSVWCEVHDQTCAKIFYSVWKNWA